MNKETRKKAKLFAWKYFIVDVARILAAPSVFLFLRPKWLYENENAKKTIRGAAVVVSNHDSFLDPMYIMIAVWYRRMRILATSDLYQHKSLDFFLRVVRCIKVDKKNFNFSTFREVSDSLNEGEVVTIFPEGTINDGTQESVRAFKSGAVLMAQKGNAPIVPIYIDQRPNWLHRQCYVMGEPIQMTGAGGGRATLMDINRITDELQKKELKLKAIMEAYHHKTQKNGGNSHV